MLEDLREAITGEYRLVSFPPGLQSNQVKEGEPAAVTHPEVGSFTAGNISTLGTAQQEQTHNLRAAQRGGKEEHAGVGDTLGRRWLHRSTKTREGEKHSDRQSAGRRDRREQGLCAAQLATVLPGAQGHCWRATAINGHGAVACNNRYISKQILLILANPFTTEFLFAFPLKQWHHLKLKTNISAVRHFPIRQMCSPYSMSPFTTPTVLPTFKPGCLTLASPLKICKALPFNHFNVQQGSSTHWRAASGSCCMRPSHFAFWNKPIILSFFLPVMKRYSKLLYLKYITCSQVCITTSVCLIEQLKSI